MARVVLVNNEIYHIYNRSIEHRPVFTHYREYSRALLCLDFYRSQNPLLSLSKVLLLEINLRNDFLAKLRSLANYRVDFLGFSFMPNHFHFLIRQNYDNGISRFMSDFCNSYTRYFNIKNKRVGPLFQGIFKAKRIETDQQLIHVNRYIHINPVVSCIIKESALDSYLWTSLPEYLGNSDRNICETETILNYFSSKKAFWKFTHDLIDYGKRLEAIKHLIIE